jgi:hypothetical protein
MKPRNGVPLETDRLIADIIHIADNINTRTPNAYTAIRAVAADGYPTGGTVGIGGIANPTMHAALSEGRHAHADIVDRLKRALGALEDVEHIVAHYSRLAPTDAAREYQRARCSGGGAEPWADPTCTRNAVTRDGLCGTCYQRKRRHDMKDNAA